jgi:hypothetical protein
MTQLYQSNAPLSKGESPHDNGWTKSQEGAIYEAKKLSAALCSNPRATWFLTIYIRPVLDARQHKLLFQKAARVLRKNKICAFWIREILPTDKLHYHILVRNDISREHLAEICESAFPERSITSWHKRIMAVPSVQDHNRISRYITKAKIIGKYRGRVVNDKYKHKRHLFQAKTGLNKHGTLGGYWSKNPDLVWDEIKKRERELADICRTVGMDVGHVKYILRWRKHNGQRRDYQPAC